MIQSGKTPEEFQQQCEDEEQISAFKRMFANMKKAAGVPSLPFFTPQASVASAPSLTFNNCTFNMGSTEPQNLQQVKNTIYNSFSGLPSSRPPLVPAKRNLDLPAIPAAKRSFRAKRNNPKQEKVVYISGCMKTDRDWFNFTEFFKQEPAVSHIVVNKPMTGEDVGRFFFECWNALDADERYDTIIDYVEPLLEQNHPEVHGKAISVFENLTESYIKKFN